MMTGAATARRGRVIAGGARRAGHPLSVDVGVEPRRASPKPPSSTHPVYTVCLPPTRVIRSAVVQALARWAVLSGNDTDLDRVIDERGDGRPEVRREAGA